MKRLLSDTVFELAQGCADRIRALGLIPDTTPYMRGQLGYGDYIADLEALCEVWNGSFADPTGEPHMGLFEWDAVSESRSCFRMTAADAEDCDWSGPRGYRFSESDHWRMEELFRYMLFAFEHSVLENGYLVLPEFGNLSPLLECSAQNVRSSPPGEFRDAYLDATDPQWRTQARRF
jgi:hypothetical protein